MLAIKPAQMEKMREYSLGQYVERTLEQFRRHFPRHVHIIGDDPMRAMIRLGVDRARAYDLFSERDVTLYTSLMLLFGSFFDEDPQCKWARDVLSEHKDSMPHPRALALYDRGVAEWNEIAGPDNAELVKALVRARACTYDELSQLRLRELPDLLRRVHPQKATALGSSGLEALTEEAQRSATRLGLRRDEETPLWGALMFALGSGLDRDPMFPWISETIATRGVRSEAPARRAFDASMKYMDAWLAHVRESR